MTKTTRMLTAGLVAMVGMGANRPAVAQDLSATLPVQNRAHVADDVVATGGFPSVDRATEGTVRAARKYHAPQITDADVLLGEVSGQQLLQSDAFARLLRDPISLKLRSDPRFLQQLKLNDPGLQSALKNLDVAAALRPYGPGGCGTCMK